MAMKRDQLAKIKRLVELFEKREQVQQQSTEAILEAIGPTTLEALFELFDVPYESVSWLDAQLVDTVIVLVASIVYGEDQKVPPIIQALSPAPNDGRPSIRLFRVGIPLELVFQSKDEIVEYLLETVGMATKRSKKRKKKGSPGEIEGQDMDTGEDNVVLINGPQPEFDTSELSHEQIQQLLIFGGDANGSKH